MGDLTNVEFETSEDVEVIPTFDSMGLREDLLRGIYAYGYEKPSAIQQRAIKPSIEGRDVIAQAQSGTGKTATFAISILQQIDTSVNTCQALVLCPTRELARQICLVVNHLGALLCARCHTCIGGTTTHSDAQALSDGKHIVIGTPGRVYDMMNRGFLKAEHLKMFVLDEADEMLSRGFEEQIRDVYKYLSPDAQIMFLSATMPKEILSVATHIMKDPVQILVKNEELSLDGIKQYYINVGEDQFKFDTLVDIYATLNVSQAVIFVNTVRKANNLYDQLTSKKFHVSLMTGEMDQSDRDRVMTDFRNGNSRILVSTDVLARGIDVQQVSMVVN